MASTEHQNTCMTQLNIILECLWCLFVFCFWSVSFHPWQELCSDVAGKYTSTPALLIGMA